MLFSFKESVPPSSFFAGSITGKTATALMPKEEIDSISLSKESRPNLEIPGREIIGSVPFNPSLTNIG